MLSYLKACVLSECIYQRDSWQNFIWSACNKTVSKLCRLSSKFDVLGCKDKAYGLGEGGEKNESREHCFCVPVKSEFNWFAGFAPYSNIRQQIMHFNCLAHGLQIWRGIMVLWTRKTNKEFFLLSPVHPTPLRGLKHLWRYLAPNWK